MNDKIRIITQDYELTETSKEKLSNPQLKQFRSIIESNHQDFTAEQIETIYSTFAPSNLTYYNDDADYKVSKDYNGLKVEFNPNKVNGKNPTDDILSLTEINQTFEKVESKLSDIGIKVKLKKQLINSYHQCFDIQTPKEYQNYFPILQSVQNPNPPIRKAVPRIIEDTLYCGSKRTNVVVYDKTKESNLNQNVIRFELKREKIKKEYRHSLANLTESKYYKIRFEDKSIIDKMYFDAIIDTAVAEQIELLQTLWYETEKTKEFIERSFVHFVNPIIQQSGLNIRQILQTSKQDDLSRYKRLNNIANLFKINCILAENMMQDYEIIKQLFKAVA